MELLPVRPRHPLRLRPQVLPPGLLGLFPSDPNIPRWRSSMIRRMVICQQPRFVAGTCSRLPRLLRLERSSLTSPRL